MNNEKDQREYFGYFLGNRWEKYWNKMIDLLRLELASMRRFVLSILLTAKYLNFIDFLYNQSLEISGVKLIEVILFDKMYLTSYNRSEIDAN